MCSRTSYKEADEALLSLRLASPSSRVLCWVLTLDKASIPVLLGASWDLLGQQAGRRRARGP